MVNIEKTRLQMEEELVGKQFLYKSECGGETVGIIKGVGVTYQAGFDEVTEKRVGYRLSQISPKLSEEPKPEKQTEPYTRWVGSKLKFVIISDTKNRYELDEVYILTTHEKVTLA